MSSDPGARQLVPAVLSAAADGRADDVDFLLADADRDTLGAAVVGLVAAVWCVLTELPPARRAELRDAFSRYALAAAVQGGDD